MSDELRPIVRFVRMIAAAPPPQRGDRAAGGTLPTRAFRFCDAATTASSLGWYVFPPTPFRLYWTGTETFWSYPGCSNWNLLGSAQFPGFREVFNAAAPASARDYSPSFLGALPEPGLIQVWSGLIAQTRADWSLTVRAPANLPRAAGYDVFEGVIESDKWFGPLFANIRLTRTDTVIDFNPAVPLFQVQPIERAAYSDEVLNDVKISDFCEMDEMDWRAYDRTVVEPSKTRCPHGAYAIAVRRRRRQELKSLQPASIPP